MPDKLTDPAAGPDGMYSTTEPPTRGQYHALAVAALDLLQVPAPRTRMDATVALTRLRVALSRDERPQVTVDPITEF